MSVDVAQGASLTQRVATEIKVAMVRRGVTGRQLALRLSVSQTWMSTRLTGATPIDLNDLERIAKALEVSAVELLRSAAEAHDGSIAQTIRRPERTRHAAVRMTRPRSAPPARGPRQQSSRPATSQRATRLAAA